MKKLVALASMAVLLCASASFAKKAMDEEEMDLITAAGQPSIMEINVVTSGIGTAEGTAHSESEVEAELDASASVAASPNTASASTDPTALGGNVGLGVTGEIGPFEIAGSGALNVDFADADVESFSLSIASGSVGTLTATASASATSSVTGAMASVTAMHDDSSTVMLLVASGSQSNLRAIVLNNVAGENQLASAVNIQSGVSQSSAAQSNSITQSWGSTYDWSFVEGDIVATAADAAEEIEIEGGEGEGGAGGEGDEITKSPCILSTNCNSSGGGGGAGNGGDANGSIIDSGNGDAAVGVLPHLPLTIAADKITRVNVESTGDAIIDVSEMDSSTITINVESNSQNNLAALIVNNIGGRNQVASAINAQSNTASLIGNSNGTAFVQFDAPGTGGESVYGVGSVQSNVVNQFRGTPYQQFAPAP